MEADWDEVRLAGAVLREDRLLTAEHAKVARTAFPPPGIHALHTAVTTLAFDNLQELLWTGNEFVRDPRVTDEAITRRERATANPRAHRAESRRSTAPSSSNTLRFERTPPAKVPSSSFCSMKRASSRSRPGASTWPSGGAWRNGTSRTSSGAPCPRWSKSSDAPRFRGAHITS